MVKSIKSAMGVLTLLGVSSVACLFADEKSGEQAKSPEKSEMRVTEKDRQFWSFQPLMRAPLPAVQQAEWCRTPIDRFILAKQEELGLVATAPVLREKLLRRLSFDLVGLPPSPEELEQFLADSPPDAEQQFVEKLLASPRASL